MAGEPAPWAHLDPADRRIGLSRLRQRVARHDSRLLGGDDRSRAESAVLVPLYEHDGEVHVVLTRRSPEMRNHRHEVSFPGGRHDAGDADLWATALREAHEEIALDPGLPERIGELDRFVTVGSRTLVHPYVAELPERPELVPEPSEVEAILHVPLSDLLADETYREERWPISGVHRPITFFEIVGDTIWGATASMLRQLLAIATGTDASMMRP